MTILILLQKLKMSVPVVEINKEKLLEIKFKLFLKEIANDIQELFIKNLTSRTKN